MSADWRSAAAETPTGAEAECRRADTELALPIHFHQTNRRYKLIDWANEASEVPPPGRHRTYLIAINKLSRKRGRSQRARAKPWPPLKRPGVSPPLEEVKQNNAPNAPQVHRDSLPQRHPAGEAGSGRGGRVRRGGDLRGGPAGL